MTFGARPIVRKVSIDLTLAPGDRVRFSGGRMRGGSGVLEAIEDVPTPSGRSVRVARVRRPRAGVSYEFPDLLERMVDRDR